MLQGKETQATVFHVKGNGKNNQSNGRSKTRAAATQEQKQYTSPYSVECPLDFIIIHNRSKNAANFAARKLKEAWPSVKLIHVVQGDRDPIPGSDFVVRID